MTLLEKVTTKSRLLAAATQWVASDLYFQSRPPGPNDDAQMDLNDDQLLEAARNYVEAHTDVKTANQHGEEMRRVTEEGEPTYNPAPDIA